MDCSSKAGGSSNTTLSSTFSGGPSDTASIALSLIPSGDTSSPDAPTVSLTTSPTSITQGQSSTLTWSSTNATSCTGTNFTASGTSGSTTVTPANTTTYSITCTGDGGSVTRSATVTVSAPADTTPPTLSNIQAETTGTSTTITWNTNEPATSAVDIGLTTSYGTTVSSQTLTTNHNITIQNLTQDTIYHYRVRSADASGNERVSQDRTLTTKDTIPPAAITDLTVPATTDKTATLTWTAPGDNGNTETAASYDIRYSTSPIDASNFQSATALSNPPSPKPAGTIENVTIGSLQPNTLYYTAIITEDKAGNRSGISNVPSFATDPTNGIIDTTPPVISNIDASDMGGRFDDIRWEVTWNTNKPADSLVRFGTNQNNLTREVSASALTEGHALALTLLTRKTTYYYTVSSTDASGNTAVSSVNSFSTVGRPSKVENLQAERGSVILTWDSVSDETVERILVYRTTPGSTQTLIATLPASATTYTDAAAGATSAYTFTVYTEDADGVRSEPASVSLGGVSQRGAVPSAPGTPPIPTRDLALGERGEDVRQLQRLLNAQGFTVSSQGAGSPGQETDFFGPATREALARFQASKGIESTGYFGPLTRAALSTTPAPTTPRPTATPSSGIKIAEFVELLIALEFIAPHMIEQARAVVQDMVPAASTHAPNLTHTLYIGQRDAETNGEVSRLQEFLRQTGDFTYPEITGYFGPATEQAVRRFQARINIVSSGSPETTGYGVAGPQTREVIAGYVF